MKTSVYIPDDLLAAAGAADRQLAKGAPSGPSHLVQRALTAYVEEASRVRRRRRASDSPLAKVAKAQLALGELERALLAITP